MSFKENKDFKFSFFMVVDCMMEPLRQKLKTPKTLTEGDMAGNLQSVEAIVHMITATSQTSSAEVHMSKDAWDNVISTFVEDVCIPILYSLHIFPDSTNRNSLRVKARSVTVHGISSCLQHIKDKNALCKVIFQVLSPLSSLNTESRDFCHVLKDPGLEFANSLDTYSSLELFDAVFSDQKTVEAFLSNVSLFECEKDALLKHLFYSALIASERECNTFSKSLNVVTRLLPLCSVPLQRDLLSEVWHRFTQPLEKDLDGNVTKESLWQTLFAFYHFKDFLFPLEKSQSNILAQHLGDEFWTCIQAGLLSIEPSHRKLAMYLIKRLVDTCHQNGCTVNSVGNGNATLKDESCQNEKGGSTTVPMFWWQRETSSLLSEIWEDFILLIETLEEKQVHVIKPVLSRLEKLIVSFSTPLMEGMFPLHASWLMIIFIRCFHHESHYMSRWAAVKLLTLDFNQVPLVKHGQMKFLSQDLLRYLQENKLYSRYNDTELGGCSPVGEALGQFFARLCASMNRSEKAEYLSNVLQKMLDNTWGSIPMVFLSQGLGNTPAEPIFGSDGLKLIRHILHVCLTTHELQARAAIQCFLGQMIMNLVDLNSTDLLDFFKTLTGLKRDESFKRGICLWENVVKYLQNEKVSSQWDDKQVLSIAFDFLKENRCQVYDGIEVLAITRMLLLFADASISGVSLPSSGDVCPERGVLEKSPLGVILNEMQSILSNIRSRSYINVAHVDTCLAVMHSLSKEIGDVCHTDHVGMFIKAKLGQSFQYAVSFVVRRLSQDLSKPQDLDEMKFYSSVILTLGIHCTNPLPSLQELLVFVTGAFNLTSQDTANPGVDMISTSAIRILHKVLRIVETNEVFKKGGKDVVQKKLLEMKSIHTLPLPFSRGIVNSEESFSRAQIGYVTSSFLSNKWQCQKLMLQIASEGRESAFDLKFVLESSMEDMNLGSGNSDIAVFGALEMLVKQATTHCPSLIPPLLDLAWRKLMEERKNVLFWRKLEALIPVALHSSLLEPQVDDDIKAAVDEFTEKVFSLGEDKAGVIYVMMRHLCKSGLKDDGDRKKAERMIPVLLQACDFGTIHKKWERSWLDVVAYIESLGPGLASNQITNSIAKNDISTRVVVLNWLSELKPTVKADHQFVMAFLRALCDKYLEYVKAMSYKQFSNCLSHRQKHRMILVFLFLSDFIKEDDCEEFLSKLKAGLELECHPSVTHNLEWIMMRLLIRYPSFLPSLWNAFLKFVQRKSVGICSFFLIMSHIGPKLPKDSQLNFYDEAFPAIMPWTMANHNTVRIFAQACLCVLWRQCVNLNLERIPDRFALVQSTIEFLYSNCNASSTVPKLRENFILSGFDPVRDFSAETIFYTLPRLASICDDEWISPSQLVLQDKQWRDGEKPVPLLNATQQLSGCKEGPWKIRTHAESADVSKKMHGDVQKKIMPWRQMSPDADTESELASDRHTRNKDGLILVTSLIDKLPNLGGLCRTSEIFGVSEFVIGNLAYVEDRVFQSLSVSAEKWLPITEVLRPKLPDYLAEKRRAGYTLVGVEQTANSVSLDEYTFPKKSLLVLGNEKEGIPPDLIQTLDICVEIPQSGIIRSLNVHVCGALIVWEYTRQHIEKETPYKTDGPS